MTPTPAYPIHPYSIIIAGGEVRSIPIGKGIDFFEEMGKAYKSSWPRPKMLIINFPHNPTTQVLDGLEFFEKVVAFAKENNVIILHDLAYADLVFDDYKAPSFLQVPGAKDVGVEFFSLTKSYSMAGWRVGFCVGNKDIVGALIKIKSYLDYGMFQPIQIASIVALRGPQDCVEEVRKTYESREERPDKRSSQSRLVRRPAESNDVCLARGYRTGSRNWVPLNLPSCLSRRQGVAVSPGIGFGEGGDNFVRFALVENEHRIRQATKGIRKVLQK